MKSTHQRVALALGLIGCATAAMLVISVWADSAPSESTKTRSSAGHSTQLEANPEDAHPSNVIVEPGRTTVLGAHEPPPGYIGRIQVLVDAGSDFQWEDWNVDLRNADDYSYLGKYRVGQRKLEIMAQHANYQMSVLFKGDPIAAHSIPHFDAVTPVNLQLRQPEPSRVVLHLGRAYAEDVIKIRAIPPERIAPEYHGDTVTVELPDHRSYCLVVTNSDEKTGALCAVHREKKGPSRESDASRHVSAKLEPLGSIALTVPRTLADATVSVMVAGIDNARILEAPALSQDMQLPAGSYELVIVSKDKHYIPTHCTAGGPPSYPRISVAPGQVRNITIADADTGMMAVSGLVRKESHPVAAAVVQAVRTRHAQRDRSEAAHRVAVLTQEDGTYRLLIPRCWGAAELSANHEASMSGARGVELDGEQLTCDIDLAPAVFVGGDTDSDQVALRGADNKRILRDRGPNGRFTFGFLPAGQYECNRVAAGVIVDKRVIELVPPVTTLRLTASASNCIITLNPAPAVGGTVELDERAEQAARFAPGQQTIAMEHTITDRACAVKLSIGGNTVRLRAVWDQNGGPTLQVPFPTSRVRLADHPGTSAWALVAQGRLVSEGIVNIGITNPDDILVYPGVYRLRCKKSDGSVEEGYASIEGGDSVIHLSRQGYEVQYDVNVVDESGRPVVGAKVWCRSSGQSVSGAATTDTDGKCSLRPRASGAIELCVAAGENEASSHTPELSVNGISRNTIVLSSR